MLKARVWLAASLLLCSGVAANEPNILPTANGMAKTYATHYGKPGDAIQIGICGRDDRKKVTKDTPEMFALAGVFGRLGKCKGGGMSPFSYTYKDKHSGVIKENLFIAATQHQWNTCSLKYSRKYNISNSSSDELIDIVESKIVYQPNGHFKEYLPSNNYDWKAEFKMEVIRESIQWFKNLDADVILLKFKNKNLFLNGVMPDGNKRIDVPPIIGNINDANLKDFFASNTSIVLGSYSDKIGGVGSKFFEKGGGKKNSTRKIDKIKGKQYHMATNHTAYFGISGSPILLQNSNDEIGLFGVMQGGSFDNSEDQDINPFFRRCLFEGSTQNAANEFIPSGVIVDFLSERYGEPAGSFIEFDSPD